MKYVLILFSFLLVLILASLSGNAVNAQIAPTPTPQLDSDGDGIPDSDDLCPFEPGPRENRGCPLESPTSTPVPDTDGDGIPDTEDKCPTVPGSRKNQGCPPEKPPKEPTDNPPNNDPNPDQPTFSTPEPTEVIFTPPALSNDGCFVTPATNNKVNVRKAADLGAEVLGYLLPGTVYEAKGYVLIGTDMWFLLSVYEGSTGIDGYASRSALRASACAEIADSSASGLPKTWNLTLKRGVIEQARNTTIEYCVYQEVGEAGNYKEVCYEVEIPEGCTVTSSEAGVFTVDCGDPVTVNPLFDNPPADGFAVPTRNAEGAIMLQMVFNQPSTSRNTTAEYCVYEEVGEAGNYKEVCYEIEVPEGCWLKSAEAGVFTLQCRPEIGGEVSFTTNRPNSTNDGANDRQAGTGLVVRHDNPEPFLISMANKDTSNGAFRDCNNNGIDDLEEFLPPDCMSQLTSNTGDSSTAKETVDWWTQVLNLSCGGNWLIIVETDEDGDEVVTDAACD